MNADEKMAEYNPDNSVPDSVHAMIDAAQEHNQVQAQQAQALAQIKANTWNTNKFRDEYEAAKCRLSDQKFNIADYPDPLQPRAPAPRQYPAGFTAEHEQNLKGLITKIRAEGGGC